VLNSIARQLSGNQKQFIKRYVIPAPLGVASALHALVLNPINRMRYQSRKERKLEIGPGDYRIPGFETLKIVTGRHVDYVANASRRMPFPDNSFDLIYASHIIEHVPWYQVRDTLAEWVRVLKPGGALEIWTPDGLKIAKAFVDAELNGGRDFEQDGWWRFNDDHDPCVWMSGRCFSYGDGSGRLAHPNWHLALFSDRYLKKLLAEVGLVDIRQLSKEAIRGYDHGWINLGFTGRKPS
jgi:SAM-dependent methyltransferase